MIPHHRGAKSPLHRGDTLAYFSLTTVRNRQQSVAWRNCASKRNIVANTQNNIYSKSHDKELSWLRGIYLRDGTSVWKRGSVSSSVMYTHTPHSHYSFRGVFYYCIALRWHCHWRAHKFDCVLSPLPWRINPWGLPKCNNWSITSLYNPPVQLQ